eukprot:311659-Amphidinium_carterae.2
MDFRKDSLQGTKRRIYHCSASSLCYTCMTAAQCGPYYVPIAASRWIPCNYDIGHAPAQVSSMNEDNTI